MGCTNHSSAGAAACCVGRRGVGWALVVWLAVVTAGIAALGRHAGRAGRQAVAATVAPVDASLPLAVGRASLVLVIHPQCPCSLATLSELETLLTRVGDTVEATVLFSQPAGVDRTIECSPTWAAAGKMAGVNRLIDGDGAIAARLDAKTSGQAFLYDDEGRLQFAGGITPSRGHVGANPGRAAIEAILAGQSPDTHESHVFGCSLR